MTNWRCPDCNATFVQDGPIVPACTYCAYKDGWRQNARGWWLPPGCEDQIG